jgi:hypothetical protein
MSHSSCTLSIWAAAFVMTASHLLRSSSSVAHASLTYARLIVSTEELAGRAGGVRCIVPRIRVDAAACSAGLAGKAQWNGGDKTGEANLGHPAVPPMR